VKSAIQNTLPPDHRTRNDSLKRFVRMLAMHPDLRGKSTESIWPYVKEWHRRARSRIRTKEFRPTWREAEALWRNVDPRKQAIDGLAATAFEEALPEFAAERGYKPKLVKLVLVCRALQRVWGDEPFHLDAG